MSQSECGRDCKLQVTLWIILSLHTREQQSRYWGTASHRPQFESDTKNRILVQFSERRVPGGPRPDTHLLRMTFKDTLSVSGFTTALMRHKSISAAERASRSRNRMSISTAPARQLSTSTWRGPR
jgi:hypothetical protein